MKQNYSIYHEGKQLKKEIKDLHKRLKAEIKELKKRYKKYVGRTCKALNDPTIQEDIGYMLALETPMRDCMDALYNIGGEFEGWDE